MNKRKKERLSEDFLGFRSREGSFTESHFILNPIQSSSSPHKETQKKKKTSSVTSSSSDHEPDFPLLVDAKNIPLTNHHALIKRSTSELIEINDDTEEEKDDFKKLKLLDERKESKVKTFEHLMDMEIFHHQFHQHHENEENTTLEMDEFEVTEDTKKEEKEEDIMDNLHLASLHHLESLHVEDINDMALDSYRIQNRVSVRKYKGEEDSYEEKLEIMDQKTMDNIESNNGTKETESGVVHNQLTHGVKNKDDTMTEERSRMFGKQLNEEEINRTSTEEDINLNHDQTRIDVEFNEAMQMIIGEELDERNETEVNYEIGNEKNEKIKNDSDSNSSEGEENSHSDEDVEFSTPTAGNIPRSLIIEKEIHEKKEEKSEKKNEEKEVDEEESGGSPSDISDPASEATAIPHDVESTSTLFPLPSNDEPCISSTSPLIRLAYTSNDNVTLDRSETVLESKLCRLPDSPSHRSPSSSSHRIPFHSWLIQLSLSSELDVSQLLDFHFRCSCSRQLTEEVAYQKVSTYPTAFWTDEEDSWLLSDVHTDFEKLRSRKTADEIETRRRFLNYIHENELTGVLKLKKL
ncbi:hypothetical protein HMI54_003382 [Coelomomyces lativittatus]|nr:hypothetical protein HMI56_000459 [Coelomomyces lativittatus]KAJ1508230.1 hypothetical protein HMI54_003382 [Coelomomyces lativittatus]KAJ1510605.1 hypothetical protein HMI55_006928 [Coelomomyces lativittatus]